MKKIFSDHRGESLMESLISMFILSILVLAITGVILVSLRISNRAIENAATMQAEWLDPLFRGDYAEDDDGVRLDSITFNFGYFGGAIGIDATVPILIYQHPTGGTWAFRPDEGEEP